jgi:hypothetical protein
MIDIQRLINKMIFKQYLQNIIIFTNKMSNVYIRAGPVDQCSWIKFWSPILMHTITQTPCKIWSFVGLSRCSQSAVKVFPLELIPFWSHQECSEGPTLNPFICVPNFIPKYWPYVIYDLNAPDLMQSPIDGTENYMSWVEFIWHFKIILKFVRISKKPIFVSRNKRTFPTPFSDKFRFVEMPLEQLRVRFILILYCNF